MSSNKKPTSLAMWIVAVVIALGAVHYFLFLTGLQQQLFKAALRGKITNGFIQGVLPEMAIAWLIGVVGTVAIYSYFRICRKEKGSGTASKN